LRHLLDEHHVEAVIAHRKKDIRKPLTPRAARHSAKDA
jgi:hypothetical protein